MPAAAAGMRNGDKIVMLDGAPVHSFDAVQAGVRGSTRATVDLAVERDGQPLAFTVPKQDGRIGLRAQVVRTPPDVRAATKRALVFPAEVMAALAGSLRDAVLGPSRPTELAGPAQLVAEMRAGPQRGLADHFQAAAVMTTYCFLVSLLLSAASVPWRRRKTAG